MSIRYARTYRQIVGTIIRSRAFERKTSLSPRVSLLGGIIFKRQLFATILRDIRACLQRRLLIELPPGTERRRLYRQQTPRRSRRCVIRECVGEPLQRVHTAINYRDILVRKVATGQPVFIPPINHSRLVPQPRCR